MKSFIIAMILLSVIIGCVTANAIYINEASAFLCDTLSALPPADSDECIEATDALLGEWQSRRNLIELSTDLQRLGEIDTQLAALCASARSRSRDEYEKTRATLRDLFSKLRTFENFNFFDIF